MRTFRFFLDLGVSMIHGRMQAKERAKILRSFRDGNVDLLVATSVIDVPNDTVMVIDSAECFSLAQLHQFLGRIGRGASGGQLRHDHPRRSPIGETVGRLQALGETIDGMVLAERDLRQRGHGDVAGMRRSRATTGDEYRVGLHAGDAGMGTGVGRGAAHKGP